MNLIPWNFDAWLLMGKPEIQFGFYRVDIQHDEYDFSRGFCQEVSFTNTELTIKINHFGFPNETYYAYCFNVDTGEFITSYPGPNHEDRNIPLKAEINIETHRANKCKIVGFLVP